MAVPVGNSEAQSLLERGAQLVEVLPEEEYRAEHLPGALSLPLARLAAEADRQLDRSQPVITYCYDSECDLSPRAAARLESLGFEHVYDLTLGKIGWLADGLHTEGEQASTPRIGQLAHADVARCTPEDSAEQVRSRLATGEVCVVVDKGDVVLGLVRADDQDRQGETVAQVMRNSPSTFRPHVGVEELKEYLAKHGLRQVLVTRADGTLVGVVNAEELTR